MRVAQNVYADCEKCDAVVISFKLLPDSTFDKMIAFLELKQMVYVVIITHLSIITSECEEINRLISSSLFQSSLRIGFIKEKKKKKLVFFAKRKEKHNKIWPKRNPSDMIWWR